MRIVSWNIENLAPWLDASPDLARHVARLGDPDVLCLQEIRVRPSDAALIARMRTVLPDRDVHFALCNDPRNVTYRGGRAYGVATFVKSAIAATMTVPAWDREGRVVVTTIGTRSIVNLYAVNGTPKAYLDPETGGLAGDRHAYKRRLQDAVFALAESLGECVIAGDWNVSRTALDTAPRLRTTEPHAMARAQLNEHLARTGFIDAFRHRHPDDRRYTWFARYGRDVARVDYIVVSPDLEGRLREATILDDRELRTRSDHAPIAVELD